MKRLAAMVMAAAISTPSVGWADPAATPPPLPSPPPPSPEKALDRVCEQTRCTAEQHQQMEAAAANAMTPRPLITNPDWVRQPTGSELGDYYPAKAQRLKQEGQAAVQCRVTMEGRLDQCAVVSESPLGFGFGDATLKVMRFFRFRPAIRDAQPVDAHVTVPIAWRFAQPTPPPTTPAPPPSH